MNKTYYEPYEIQEILGVGETKAYQIIKKLNKDLEDMGYITVAGKVNKKYFNDHYYGGVEDI